MCYMCVYEVYIYKELHIYKELKNIMNLNYTTYKLINL